VVQALSNFYQNPKHQRYPLNLYLICTVSSNIVMLTLNSRGASLETEIVCRRAKDPPDSLDIGSDYSLIGGGVNLGKRPLQSVWKTLSR